MAGNVTADGKPLEKGVITFYPIGSGTTVGGQIIEGKFSLSTENGATPGKYRVEIMAYRPSGKTEFDIDTQTQVDIEMQYLPPRYNVKSKLECDVMEKGPNAFDFNLDTK